MTDEKIVEVMARAVDESYTDTPQEVAYEILAALRDAGYVVAPVEPTEAMIEAGDEVDMLSTFEGDPGANYPDVPNTYRAMIAALTPPAKPSQSPSASDQSAPRPGAKAQG